MKKTAIIIAVFFLFSFTALAVDQDNLLIPQTDPIYEDFYMMANAGLIKSADAESFRYSPMTQYDAAKYVVEAAGNLYAANSGSKSSYTAKLMKYYKIYREKAFEIYGKTMEMRKKIAEIENILNTSDVKELKDAVEEASSSMFDIEKEYKYTTFRGVPPFKVMGMLNVRWQDVEAFGVAPAHQTSLGGTFMQLWTEGVVNDDISFKLNLTFEKPANEAEKDDLPEYWGTGQRFLDKYTINLNAYGWTISTGFFWEDVTPFVAKQILSERPALFDKDVYALEETTKGHYENAFLHAFVARGDIWSKHGFMGVRIQNLNLDLMGVKNRSKIMIGKAEQFDERYDKLYLYEYAGRTTFIMDLPMLTGTEISLNFFNTSNEKAEIETLAPDTSSNNYPYKPDGYIQAATIAGADLKLNVANFMKIDGEFEAADTHSYLPKLFDQYSNFYPPKYNQNGTAMYVRAKLDELPVVDLSLKYTRIDADYVARASAINDTARRVSWPAGTEYGDVKINFDTYAGDPTLYYNNLGRIDLLASVEMPNSMGFINVNYGMANQLKETTNRVYVDHFLFGNRLTGAMWWHLFYSQYGFPVKARDLGFYAYNAPDHPFVDNVGRGYRYLFTEKWLTNKEMIISSTDPDETSIKNIANASIELKLMLNKMLGFENNLFLELYGELVTLSGDAISMPTFDPNMLFSQNLISAFVVYNLTRRVNIMAVGSVERWATNKSYQLTDYDGNGTIDPRPIEYIDRSFGFGLDYDFAPRTSLYLRAKKFMHEDLVYPTQDFDGWHLYAEVKNFF